MSFLSSQKRVLLLLLPFSVITIYLLYICINLRQTTQKRLVTRSLTNTSTDDSPIACLSIRYSNETLPDISDFPPNKNKKNIFFLETSCRSHDKGKLVLKARQACAVESAANMNAGSDVYLLFGSPGLFKDENTQSDRIIKGLKKYSNIKLMYLNANRYVQGSPVEPLWKSGLLQASLFPLSHTSDVLRYLTLWKYGGIYLDLDTVVIKNLDTLPENFAGAETGDTIVCGVMGFGSTGVGHQFTTECLNDLNVNFNGTQWASNGPLLLSRNILAHCPNQQASDIVSRGRCEDIYIMSPQAFYPVHWNQWNKYFDASFLEPIQNEIATHSFVIHVWNKLSVDKAIPKNETRVPYLHVARKYCPEVVKQLDEVF